ncbi:MAG: gliding motility-associated-like protein [Crocinitomicaceae bacterium]|jgi:gliding motility-associated-like protein
MKNMIRIKEFVLIACVVFINAIAFAQTPNGDCITADPFCTGSLLTFPGGVGTGTGEVGPDYGCLLTQPNPAWFYMEIGLGGNLDIEISNSNNQDIDFILYGPFADQTSPCTALLTAGNTEDCSYSTSALETANIVGAISGEFYLLLITNFSNTATDISFVDLPSSTATTNCSIICPPLIFTEAINCDGSVDVTISGGISEIDASDYIITNTGSGALAGIPISHNGTMSITGLTVGQSYSLSVTDLNGCPYVYAGGIYASTGPTIDNIAITDPTCAGGCDGTITVTVSGGTAPYTYQWFDNLLTPIGTDSPTLSGQCAGNYSVEVTDAAGGSALFFTEDFGLDVACANQNQTAAGTITTNGPWTQTVLAAEGASSNQWFVSATEAFTGTGNCGDGCLGNAALDNQTLHVGSLGVGLCPTGDCGAAYNAGGSGETHKRVESPTIDCSGQSAITMSFDYMHFGETGTDQASLAYFNGTVWTTIATPLPQTTCCGGACGTLLAQGQWSPTRYSIALPATADNNPNVRIGFIWDNNANNSGADPSFAADDITLEGTSAGSACTVNGMTTLTDPPATVISGNAPICVTATLPLSGTGTPDPTTPWVSSNLVVATIDNTGVVTGLTGGTTTITYTDNNGCQDTEVVTVNPLDDASFNYGAAAYCVSDADPTATITGLAGGTFTSAPAGLVINGATGQIDVSASTPGAYTITYTTAGPCPNNSNVAVTINALDDATFNYGAAAYCVSDADPTATITGLAGGIFTSAPAGLSINGATGQIDVSASAPSAYTITYTTAGTCPNSSNVGVTINALDDASFNFGSPSYCISDADPTATITGLAGGTFTSAPAGLIINGATGQIDVSASTPGAYTVTYTTAGPCPNSSNAAVTINALDDASFNFGSPSYCVSDADPTAIITGLAGGAFTSAPAGLSTNGATGQIDVSASIPGAYTITYTTAGICPNTSNVAVTITALDDASFNYGAAAYCVDATDPTATITGVGGGAFTSAPAGLVMNGTTGLIDVSASTPGAYTITYTTAGGCSNSSNVAVTINALDDATFNYGAAAYCVSDTDPTATITGLAGGTFTSAPAGLSINGATGQIDVSASTPGTYTITYTTAGTCPNNSNIAVTINALDDATFNYGAAAYCVDAADPTATITGLAGGTFTSAPAGLVINGATGQIDVSASTPGAYTVTYTTAGICPNSSNVAVTINALDDATFNYGAAAYCVDATDPTATITGLAGGTFTSAPAGLSINGATGQIDVSASAPGAYTITYTTAGICSNSSNVAVTINALDDATFNYGAAAYCVDATDPTATITGLAGGTFTSAPAGLVINGATGQIDVSASTPGAYTVTYTTAGICPNSSNVAVTINDLDDASFNFGSPSYCVSDADPTATITGLAGGTFTSAPAGLVINGATGQIDVSASTAGAYTITYTTAGTCPNSSNVAVTINALDDASFNFGSPSYCVSDADPTATITGLAGGAFTSAPAGLSINGATGQIDVSASTPGAYTITYTTAGTCPNSSNVAVTINDLDNATFNYVAAAYCVSDTDPTATITGVGGGTFTSAPAGLSINGATGQIDVSASTPGAYTITYTTSGTCTNSSNVAVTINPLDDATFNYGAAAYCVDASDPTATITGLGGGTFTSAPAGLSINGATGQIDVSASTPGAYTITYTTSGTCPNSSNVAVTIDALDDATFNFGSATYCANEPDPTATVTGLVGGTFTSAPAGLVINGSAGIIDVSTSTPGAYTVTYTTSGTCPNTSNVSVTVNPTPIVTPTNSGPVCADAASFTLDEVEGIANSWVWVSNGAAVITNPTDQSPTVTGAVDGEVFTVTGTDINGCSNTGQTTVTINPLPVATPTSDGPICAGSQLTLDETGGDATSWSWGTSGTSVITTITDQSTTVTGAVDGEVYTVTVTDINGCTNTANTTASVIVLPALDAIVDAIACDSYTLPAIAGTDLSGTEAYYDDSQANGGLLIAGPITSSQTVWVYDGNGTCSDETSFFVTINTTDDASFTLTDFCQGDVNSATVVGATGGTFSFDPDLNDGSIIDAVTGSIEQGVPETLYTISYTTAGLCPATSTATVLVNACEILIPTAITPENIPNNTWEVPNLDVLYPNNTVSIFNRWGTLLFEHVSSPSNPYSGNEWDGTFKGELLPVASYYYIINYNDGSGDGANGTITIIRN